MITEIEFGTPAYDVTVMLRDKLLRKPLGLVFSTEEMASEYACYHIAYYGPSGALLGCLVLSPIDQKILQMKQVAVEEIAQNQGIGTQLVLAAEQIAKERAFAEMELHSRDIAIPFYEKLGYKKIGKGFVEVNIPHFKMKKVL